MSWLRLLKFATASRVLLIMMLLFSAQATAWQNPGYRPYYNSSPYYYYSQPAYYRSFQPAYYSSRPVYAPVKLEAEAHTDKLEQQDKDVKKGYSDKKQDFIQRLLPHINKENARLRQLRIRLHQLLSALEANRQPSEESKLWLQQQAKRYRVKGNPVENLAAANELLRKIDIIPASLTLAQAANESAWGKSRFATQANNYFGIWTFDESKGLIPREREAQKKHLVRKFEHLAESVRYYMLMLNSHPAYRKLRDIRWQTRQTGSAPDGLKMAAGLEKYSARGEEYIQLIQQLIRQNRWARLDTIKPSA